MKVDPDAIETLEEVAARLRKPPATLRYWRHVGDGPKSFKLGRRVAYLRADVDAWLVEQMDRAT